MHCRKSDSHKIRKFHLKKEMWIKTKYWRRNWRWNWRPISQSSLWRMDLYKQSLSEMEYNWRNWRAGIRRSLRIRASSKWKNKRISIQLLVCTFIHANLLNCIIIGAYNCNRCAIVPKTAKTTKKVIKFDLAYHCFLNTPELFLIFFMDTAIA